MFTLRLCGVEEINSSSSTCKEHKEKTMERLNSGKLKTIFRNIFSIVLIGLTTSGRKAWQEEETRNDTGTVLIHQEQFFTSELFKVIQDAISFIPSDFFQYIYHVGCAINLHSIINSGWINTWRSKIEQQTDSILSACGSHGQKP